MSGDLAAFLRARLDEDEAAAKAAPGGCWQSFGEDDVAGASVYDEQWVLLSPARYDHDNPLSSRPGATGPQYIQRARDELCAHIARHDPARVLREVEAKRKILTLVRIAREMTDTEPLETDIDRASAGAIIATGHMVLIALAAVYRDHPGYRQEWAP